MAHTPQGQLEKEISQLDKIVKDIESRGDLKDILLRINGLQRVVFEEIERRKRFSEPDPAA